MTPTFLGGLWRAVRGESSSASAARAAYLAVVAAARRPAYYTRYRVPDTVDGRFEMIVLHAVLLVRRIKGRGDYADRFGREFMSHLFDDMDRNLREMGTGDMRVGRRIKEMAEAFYGRARVYQAALDAGAGDALAEALERNAFPLESPGKEVLDGLATSLAAQARDLDSQPLEAILAGNVAFSAVEAPESVGTDSN